MSTQSLERSNFRPSSEQRNASRSARAALLLAAVMHLATASTAFAAPSGANKSPAKVDIQTVEVKMKSITKKFERSDWKDPNILDEIAKMLDDVETRIARIKERDKDWDTSSFETFFSESTAKWKKASEEVNAAHGEMQLDLERRARFTTIGDRHGAAIQAGLMARDGQVRGALGHVREDMGAILALSALAKECEDRQYPTIQKYYEDEGRAKQPKVVCELAGNHQKIAETYVSLAAKARLEDQLKVDQEALTALEQDGALSNAWLARVKEPAAHAKQVASEFAELTASASVTIGADHFKPLEAQAKKFKEVLTAAGRVDRFPKAWSTNDAKLNGSVSRQVKSFGGTLVKLRTSGTTMVEKNALGIPLAQSTRGAALVRVASDGGFCRLYDDVGFSGTYKGGGAYAPLSYASGIEDEFKVTVCSK
ncbi:hypothetical protein [Myxococcus sp. AB056]|uniref:hypothetical protein n=1 Tax=Myxococcus sp. AB056 TaxID=2562792 RepID=UPI001E31EDB9|nr:hypothetical protein [Myxococcus sp. AB056]